MCEWNAVAHNVRERMPYSRSSSSYYSQRSIENAPAFRMRAHYLRVLPLAPCTRVSPRMIAFNPIRILLVRSFGERMQYSTMESY